jgi:hypothetical protein
MPVVMVKPAWQAISLPWSQVMVRATRQAGHGPVVGLQAASPSPIQGRSDWAGLLW